MSQFGSKAVVDGEKLAAEAKAKQKADEFDSEEDDEEEWERNYAEEQAKKKEQAALQATKAPVFGGAVSGFMSQFAKNAETFEEAQKAKRKAEEFDSEEDDEEEWERNYAEEQRLKKEKLNEAKDGASLVFVPGKGFVQASAPKEIPPSQSNSSETPNLQQKAKLGGGESVFSASGTKRSHAVASSNIFGHLSNGSSRNPSDDDDDDADADDDEEKPRKRGRTTASRTHQNQKFITDKDDTDDETIEETMRRRTQETSGDKASQVSTTPGKSLFDRISSADSMHDQSKNSEEGNSSSFEGVANGNSTGQSSMFGNSTSSDHTWKADSPIKFGGTAPAISFTSATPTKLTSTNGTESTTPAARPFASLFSTAKPEASTSLFGTQKSNEIGFGFGGPPKTQSASVTPFLFPVAGSNSGSVLSSAATSRATSPGAPSSVPDSTNGDGDEAAPAEVQSDFTALTAEERRDENVLFEVEKARCMFFNKDAGQTWEVKGTGPLRVLKNKNSGATRVILRVAPTGKVVINSRVQKSYTYTHMGKGQTRFMIVGSSGKPETYVAKMAQDEDAKRFAEVCEGNKDG